jgi:hypothetical protein
VQEGASNNGKRRQVLTVAGQQQSTAILKNKSPWRTP